MPAPALAPAALAAAPTGSGMSTPSEEAAAAVTPAAMDVDLPVVVASPPPSSQGSSDTPSPPSRTSMLGRHAWHTLQQICNLFVSDMTTIYGDMTIPQMAQHLVNTVAVMGYGRPKEAAITIVMDLLANAEFSAIELQCARNALVADPPTTLCFPRSQTAAQLSTIWSSTRPQ